MNGRLLLLVLVSAMFMAAWDGDQAAMQEALARRNERQAARIAALSDGAGTAPVRSPQVTSVSHRTTTTALRTAAKPITPSVDVSVPLPPSIAAGNYQAVSQSGTTVMISVPQERSPNAPARDFYVADSETGERWFLIRIVR